MKMTSAFAIGLVLAVLPAASLAIDPNIMHVGLVAPDILGITIVEGRVIRGDIIDLTPQAGDVLVNDPPPTSKFAEKLTCVA